MDGFHADVAVIGGSLGGCAAADAAARMGYRVLLTERTSVLGGQLTNQAVPPDEHPWIESLGCTARYRALRDGVRAYYRHHLPLSSAARRQRYLNPGGGWVSRLCHDPRVARSVINEMLAPHILSGRLMVWLRHRPVAAHSRADRIVSVLMRDLENDLDRSIEAPYFIDATRQGALLPLAGVEHALGAESQSETGEPHALERADSTVQQAITVCFAIDYLPGEDHTIDKPATYTLWRDYRPPGWPGKLLDWTAPNPETGEPKHWRLFPEEPEDRHSLWAFRRLLDRQNFESGFVPSDVTLVNWPQNDYCLGPMLGVDEFLRSRHFEEARQLSLSLLYWMQTEAPRPDGGLGYKGLRLRTDVIGTPEGLAEPYIRESRRIKAEFTVLEQHIAHPLRSDGAEPFFDSVGIGCYRIDLHPRSNSAGYLDLGCWPFQIPLGALIPVRVDNLLPGSKNLGVTHITNGAYRLHPVEWNIGEAAGLLSAFCLKNRVVPRQVRNDPALLEQFQALLEREGIPLRWPQVGPL